MISTTQLAAAMPHATADRIALFIQPINDTFDRFSISTPLRQATFLAQIAVESGSLHYVREIADGSAYEGRADLGNTEPGDGRRFPGRGLGQITGRRNYTVCGIALGLDLVAHPELLEEPEYAAQSAGWYWSTHGLNGLADAKKFGTACKVWNGGYMGIDERIEHYLFARNALGVA
jgi:putative chitinase